MLRAGKENVGRGQRMTSRRCPRVHVFEACATLVIGDVTPKNARRDTYIVCRRAFVEEIGRKFAIFSK